MLRSYANGGILEIVPEGALADAHFSERPDRRLRRLQRLRWARRASGRTLLISQVSIDPEGLRPTSAMTIESAYLTVIQDGRFYGIRADTLTISARVGR